MRAMAATIRRAYPVSRELEMGATTLERDEIWVVVEEEEEEVLEGAPPPAAAEHPAGEIDPRSMESGSPSIRAMDSSKRKVIKFPHTPAAKCKAPKN